MRSDYTYLQDSAFLKEVDDMIIKEQHVKITTLDFIKELPIQTIEGKVSGGSFTIDSSSPVRRTASISVVADDTIYNLTNIKSALSINKKVKIEVGFTNTTKKYEKYDILWFPMGTYLISSPAVTHDLNGININLTLKDKMCLLNGEVGGALPASIDLINLEYINKKGQIEIVKPTVFQIILELVNHWGGEQLGKIIISDVPHKIDSPLLWNDDEEDCYVYKVGDTWEISTEEHPDAEHYKYGDLVGYLYTDFVYPAKEYVTSPGENIAAVLSKIVTELGGNYEFFYDVDGNFIFREIKNYLNNSLSKDVIGKLNTKESEEPKKFLIDRSKGKSVYSFEDNKIISSFSNTPQFDLIKNDYIIWGKRKTSNTPIRYHVAIDQKPQEYNEYRVILEKYPDEENKYKVIGCPFMYDTYGDFPPEGIFDLMYYDKQNAQLYYWGYKGEKPEKDEEPTYHKSNKEQVFDTVKVQDWRTEIYLNGCSHTPAATNVNTISNYYYTELCNEWNKIYYITKEKGVYIDKIKTDIGYEVDYWLDIIDVDSSLSDLNINNIGRRTMVMSDTQSQCNCVFEPSVTFNYFYEEDNDKEKLDKEDKRAIKIDEDFKDKKFIQSPLSSCFEQSRNLLYQYTKYNEAITFSAIPMYYLEPNSRITVRDTESDIYGDYIITGAISLPLDINEEMTITATRALEKI